MMGKVRLGLLPAARAFFWIMLVLVGSLIQAVPIAASPETVVEVEPHASFALLGREFVVNVTILNVQDLYGVEATLSWNASVLRMARVDVRLGQPDGVLYYSLDIYENQTLQDQGTYVLAGSSLAPAPSFNGSGNLLRATFDVVGVGNCELGLEAELASILMTPEGSAHISHTISDGFFGPIELDVLPATMTLGSSVTVSGIIGSPQAGVSIAMLYRSMNESEWRLLANTTTDGRGSYSYVWKPEKGGTYDIKAAATVLGVAGTSNVVSISVIGQSGQSPWLYVGVLLVSIIIIVTLVMLFEYRRRKRKNRA
jgi:hypothetical protein